MLRNHFQKIGEEKALPKSFHEGWGYPGNFTRR